MNPQAPWRWERRAGLTALLLLCVLPVLALVPAAFANAGVAAEALSPRRVGLLLTSVRLASIVLVVDAAVAACAGLWAMTAPPRRALTVTALALAAAFVPPVAHAAAWLAVLRALRTAFGLGASPLTGLPAAALAQCTAYLPVALAVGLAGVLAVDPALVDAARTLRSDTAALWRVLLPLAVPALLAGGGIAALLSLGDESIPSAFGVNTAAMELFSAYASDGNAGAVLALAWPLALVAIATALFVAAPLRSLSLRPGWGRRAWAARPRLARATRALLAGGAALATGAAALVFATLIFAAAPVSQAAAAIAAAGADIATTAGIALVAALVAGAVALLAGGPASPASQPSRALWAVALLAAVVPPPVMGAGLVALYNHDVTAAIYDSMAMPVLASLARFAPLAALVVSVAASRLDVRVLEASLLGARPSAAFRRVVVPLLAAAATSGALLVAAFAAGELGATLMVLPPGSSTAVIRAFNLLHYGASEEVAAVALAVAALGVVAATASWAFVRRGWAR